MTMIACILNRIFPILLGDLLVSDEVRRDIFMLPSISENIMDYLTEPSRFHPYRLNQKVYILKDNVCVALAGTVSYLKQFLKDLRYFCSSRKTITAEDINVFLKRYNLGSAGEHLSFLIMTVEKEGQDFKVGQFKRGNWRELDSNIYGKVLANGSGAVDFLEGVNRSGTLITGYSENSIEYAVQSNIILISSLLAEERARLHTVKKHWGAGFEMVYFDGRKFTKFDDITYIVNHAKFDENGNIEVPIPAIILHYRYDGDILLITAVAALRGETEVKDTEIIIRYKEFVTNLFIVEPINYGRSIDIEKYKQDTSFTSYRNGMGYIIETEGGKFLPAIFNVGSELKVEYQHLSSVIITMNREINDKLVSAAKEAFPHL